MSNSPPDDFSRYLRSKQSVDDRSLNRWVYGQMREALATAPPPDLFQVLEVGCGIGTMVARLWDWGLAPRVAYTAIDREAALVTQAPAELREFACRQGLEFSSLGGSVCLRGPGREWLVTFQVADYAQFCQAQAGPCAWDLLLAHAFLDLVDLEEALPRLLALLKPGGLYYFTLNFDGQTIFQPALEPIFEAQVLHLYHQSMDERQSGRAGHSQTGRRLLAALCPTGTVLAAGSSDWLVWPQSNGTYPGDEANFLAYILETIHRALGSHPDLDQERLQAWLSRRQALIKSGQLIFLAHQLDLCGRV